MLKKKELDMWAQYIHMLIAKWEASLIEEDLTWLDALKESKIKYSGHQSCGTWKLRLRCIVKGQKTIL